MDVENRRKNAKRSLFSKWSHHCLTRYGGLIWAGKAGETLPRAFFLTHALCEVLIPEIVPEMDHSALLILEPRVQRRPAESADCPGPDRQGLPVPRDVRPYRRGPAIPLPNAPKSLASSHKRRNLGLRRRANCELGTLLAPGGGNVLFTSSLQNHFELFKARTCRTDSTSRPKAHKSKAGGWKSSPTILPTSIPWDSSAIWRSCSRDMPKQSNGASASPGEGTINDIGGGVQFRQTVTDFSPGPLRKTGNPTDVALQGDGFFRRPERVRNGLLTPRRQFSPHGQRRIGDAAGIPGSRRGQLAYHGQPYGGSLGDRFLGHRFPERYAARIANCQAIVAKRPGQESAKTSSAPRQTFGRWRQ